MSQEAPLAKKIQKIEKVVLCDTKWIQEVVGATVV